MIRLALAVEEFMQLHVTLTSYISNIHNFPKSFNRQMLDNTIYYMFFNFVFSSIFLSFGE